MRLAAPSLTGTGYIGNSATKTRAWNGLLNDLRVYDRLLSDAEVQFLAVTNLAPVVFAGTPPCAAQPAAPAFRAQRSFAGAERGLA